MLTTALLTLALAVPALVFAAWPSFVRRGDRSSAGPSLSDEERAGLENEKIIALRALRELELDRVAGHVNDEDYRDLQARYEGDAVAVLRRLDALGPVKSRPRAASAPPPEVATPWTRQPVALGAMGAGLLVFGVVLGLLVSRYSTPAPPEPGMVAAPPGMPPGMGPGSAGGGPPRPVSGDARGMLKAAHASLDAGRYQEAIAAYTAVPGASPGTSTPSPTRRDPRLAGHNADALEAFDRALAIDPNYAHALWDKAGVQEVQQDHAGAIATLERFVRVGPAGPDRDRAQERLREAKARLAATPKAGAPTVRP
jgi:tetratricopeptide (TPR) repeat protein